MIIDVFSDYLCPWCFIGERRLKRVLDELAVPVEVTFRAFQLQPGLPPEGVARADLLARRHGAGADPARVPSKVAEAAAEDALALDYSAMARVPNTLAAHRLMAAAAELPQDERWALADALFAAYFQRGLDIGDETVLLELAAPFEIGTAETAIAGAAPYQQRVERDLASAAEREVMGVPNLWFAGRFSLPGVQSPTTLKHFIERALLRLGD
ncbi:MAG: DsbA family protein [Pseudomonadota bacterium]